MSRSINKTVNGFYTLFTKIKGFDDDLIAFNSECKRIGSRTTIVLVEDGKLQKFTMFRNTYSFERWKKHFEIYFETGYFPKHFFVLPFTKKGIFPKEIDFPTGFPFETKNLYGTRDTFYTDTQEYSMYIDNLRNKYPHLDLGFEIVPHP